MQNKNDQQFIIVGIILLLIGFSAGIPSSPGLGIDEGMQEAVAATPEGLNEQLYNDVQKAIQINQSEKNTQSWSESGYTPAEIFANYRAFYGKNETKDHNLCQILQHLKADELALFEKEIRNRTNRKVIPCKDKLLKKLSNYWKQDRLNLLSQLAKQPTAHRRCGYNGQTLKGHSVNSPTLKLDAKALKNKQVSLLFTGESHGERTKCLINILRESKTKALFFPTTQSLKDNPLVAKQAVDAGHLVGVGAFPTQLPKLNVRDALEEIEKSERAIQASTGKRSYFFETGADQDPALSSLIQERNVTTISWDIDSHDWKIRDSRKLLDHVLKQIETNKKGIVAFHGTNEQTINVMPHLIEQLHKKGYSTVSFKKLAKSPRR